MSSVNAVDYLYNEWSYKPVGFVSYGGVSAGLRSVQSVKSLVTTTKAFPVPEGVAVPFFWKQFNEGGEFIAIPEQEESGKEMISELHKIATALQPLQLKD